MRTKQSHATERKLQGTDIYRRVTEEIIGAIALGAGRFQMPWHSSGAMIMEPLNVVSKQPYSGINVLILWSRSVHRGYSCPLWGTYNQWKQLGAQVKRGEKATEIVLWRTTTGRDIDGDEEVREPRMLLIRGFSVFNVAQVEGYVGTPEKVLSESERIHASEAFFAAQDMKLCHEGNRAYYDVESDRIVIPEFKRFKSPAFYYSTLSHEAIHWTGAPSRLGRELWSRFGGRAYAAEELIAELGAAFLSARFSLFGETRKNSAAYVYSWLELLRHDKRAIFTAASKAQQAANWLTERAKLKDVAA